MPFQIFAAGEEHADAIQHLQQHVQPLFLVSLAIMSNADVVNHLLLCQGQCCQGDRLNMLGTAA